MSTLNEIILDLNEFKITICYKSNKAPLLISFDKSPSRNFYCCLIALILVEMKKKGHISYINIKSEKIKNVLSQLDKNISDLYSSKEDKNRFAKIKKAWLYNLPKLSKGLHFVVEEKKIIIDEKKKYYNCDEEECDMWADLFGGSTKNTWFFKFAIDSPEIDLDLDDVSIIFDGKKDIDAWNDFLLSIEKKRALKKIKTASKEKKTANNTQYSYAKDLNDALPDLPQHEIIGRKNDLIIISAKLKNLISQKNKVFAVHGLPGIGKTTISISLPHNKKIRKLFHDGILWICLGKEPRLIQQINKYATPFASRELSTASSLDQVEPILKRLVEKGHYLIIVDDVWDISHLKVFLKISRYTPVLITTRLREIPYSLNIIPENIYKLNILSDNESLDLLCEFVPEIVSIYRKDCEELVRVLEGLPLAISVAGRLLRKEREYGLSVPQLIQQLKNGGKILESKPPAEMQLLTTEATTTVAALLKRSTESLTLQTRQCFAVLAFLPPKPEILTIDDLKGCWQVDNPEDVLRELLDFGLIENSPKKGGYQVHYLMMLLASTIQEEDKGNAI